jgi:hypothetical protein
LYLRALKKLQLNAELQTEMDRFDADERWAQDGEYVRFRATVYAEVDGRIHDAIRKLQAFERYLSNESALALSIRYLSYVKNTDQAQKLLDESKSVFDPQLFGDLQETIYDYSGNYEKSLALLRAKKARAIFPAKGANSEVHALLKLARYPEAERFARAILEPAHFAKQFDSLIINLEIARNRQAHKVNKQRLHEVADRNQWDDMVCACAYYLLDDKTNAADRVKKIVTKDKTNAYVLNYWAIFDPPADKAWLKSTLNANGLDPGIVTMEQKRVSA